MGVQLDIFRSVAIYRRCLVGASYQRLDAKLETGGLREIDDVGVQCVTSVIAKDIPATRGQP